MKIFVKFYIVIALIGGIFVFMSNAYMDETPIGHRPAYQHSMFGQPTVETAQGRWEYWADSGILVFDSTHYDDPENTIIIPPEIAPNFIPGVWRYDIYLPDILTALRWQWLKQLPPPNIDTLFVMKKRFSDDMSQMYVYCPNGDTIKIQTIFRIYGNGYVHYKSISKIGKTIKQFGQDTTWYDDLGIDFDDAKAEHTYFVMFAQLKRLESK